MIFSSPDPDYQVRYFLSFNTIKEIMEYLQYYLHKYFKYFFSSPVGPGELLPSLGVRRRRRTS
jgi:hypothetical protein